MNKSLHILIAAIILVGGLIAYTLMNRSSTSAHTAGDGHTAGQHAESLPHNDTVPHTTSTPATHDDGGQASHND